MKRRKFIGRALLVSVAGAGALQMLNRCSNPSGATESMRAGEAVGFRLSEHSIDDLQRLMTSGKMSARQIAELYLNRIREIDQQEYQLKAVIEINPDALAIADSLDSERKNGQVRGPLHGIPVLIKDNIDTGDKMMTTAGSLALDGHRAKRDAFIVAELRKAGAVLLGKTNLSEWANFRSTRSSSGWSSRGGQTKNPYLLDRSPCGSSSGSGTAVAANLCAVAIGTETNGSIACPSSINGIVGIKPTVGLWSRAGIIPISATQDTAGPMARNVKDATLLLGALTAADAQDPSSKREGRNARTDYTSFLDADALRGKVIGVERSFLKSHEAIDLLLRKALDLMESKGAKIIEVDLMEKLKDPDGDEFNFLKFEFKDGLNKYLQSANAPVKSLQDVIDYNNRNEAKAMPFFKQEILIDSQTKSDLESKEYKDLYQRLIVKTRTTIDNLFAEQKLDALCGPTNGPSWCIDLINGDFFTGYGTYSPAAVAGYPSISVPMGMVAGLPVGITFIARAFEEGELISISYSYEQASKMRVPPEFKRTLS
jgi:amidase